MRAGVSSFGAISRRRRVGGKLSVLGLGGVTRKSSQISGLAKDLARSLATVSVRVVEIIPGKPFVGLEIPNEIREIVALGEIVKSQAYDETKSPLTLALGKDIGGQPMVADLARMPHLLIAGTTGSGTSSRATGDRFSSAWRVASSWPFLS